jgi:hypothetical protein
MYSNGPVKEFLNVWTVTTARVKIVVEFLIFEKVGFVDGDTNIEEGTGAIRGCKHVVMVALLHEGSRVKVISTWLGLVAKEEAVTRLDRSVVIGQAIAMLMVLGISYDQYSNT